MRFPFPSLTRGNNMSHGHFLIQIHRGIPDQPGTMVRLLLVRLRGCVCRCVSLRRNVSIDLFATRPLVGPDQPTIAAIWSSSIVSVDRILEMPYDCQTFRADVSGRDGGCSKNRGVGLKRMIR
jgi:hypothetical protein